MEFEKPDNRTAQRGLEHSESAIRIAPDPSPSGVRRLDASSILVNLTVERRFDYRILYRLTSLAMRNGGLLEHCNGEIAMFAFPRGGVTAFLAEVGYRVPVKRTVMSPRDTGASVVNVRFQMEAHS